MATNYKTEAVKELAAQIKQAGFRVFIAQSGTYGFFTDAEGSRVVSFQQEYVGFKFSGNYRPVNSHDGRQLGTGWGMGDAYAVTPEGLRNMFNSGAPRWATNGLPVTLTTLAQHLAAYQRSSKYVEFGVAADSVIHYGLTEEEMRAKTGSTGNFDGPRPLCGNGNFHATVTREKGTVTCPDCIAQFAKR